MTCSLLLAQNLQAADASAEEWKWERLYDHDAFGRTEYRRPDRLREVVRFMPDRPDALRGLHWNTVVYLGKDWRKRNDASQIMGLLDSGFFREEDPELVAPRRRLKRDQELAEVRRTLARLEKVK